MQTKAAIFNALKKELQQQGGIKHTLPLFDADNQQHPFDSLFPNHSFPIGAVHEFITTNNTQLAASTGFVAALIHSFINNAAPLVWIGQQLQIFPNGLCAYNIAPENILFIEPKTAKDVLWCTEEALRCTGVAAVVATLEGIDFKYSRRLQLAVEKSNTTGFILNTKGQLQTNNAFVSRWQIQHDVSANNKNIPGLGLNSWQVQLLKIRNGQPKNCKAVWNNGLQIIANAIIEKENSNPIILAKYG